MDKPKKRPAPSNKGFPRKAIPAHPAGYSEEEIGRAYANVLISPEVAAFRVIQTMQPESLAEGIDTPTILEALRDQAGAVQRGDLTQAEAMLINQACALQALFTRLTELGMEQTLMPNLEGFIRLALKAQSQCRATLEALAAVKNPPVVYAKQANITSGPQQVNNGAPTESVRPRAEDCRNQQNELLVHNDGKRLDTDATGTTGTVDQELEAVGVVDRTKVRRGQGQIR